MANPFEDEFTCTGCGITDKVINAFSSNRCLNCFEQDFDPNNGPTIEEMFTNPGLIN